MSSYFYYKKSINRCLKIIEARAESLQKVDSSSVKLLSRDVQDQSQRIQGAMKELHKEFVNKSLALLFFFFLTIGIGLYHGCSKAQQVSKEQANRVSVAMKELKDAQVEHDCKNSVATRDKLVKAQEKVRFAVRLQQGDR